MKLSKSLCVLLALILTFSPILTVSAETGQNQLEVSHEGHNQISAKASSCYICGTTEGLDSVGLCPSCQWAKCNACRQIAYPRHEYCPARDLIYCFICNGNYWIYEYDNHPCN